MDVNDIEALKGELMERCTCGISKYAIACTHCNAAEALRVLKAAEHQARCDLIDALFYIEILWGLYGDYVTAQEKIVANEFWRKMRTKYPQQKGQWGNKVNQAQIEFARNAAARIIPSSAP